MLLGTIDRKELLLEPYSEWFTTAYDEYNINKGLVQELDGQLTGVHLLVFMATWCPDVHRELPRLFKILDSVAPKTAVTLVALNKEKDVPDAYADDYHISSIPTIIVLKDKHEIGRIVEQPQKTLEADLLELLNDFKSNL